MYDKKQIDYADVRARIDGSESRPVKNNKNKKNVVDERII